MSDLLDIMQRLTTHLSAALSHGNGGPIPKGDDFYLGHLSGLSDDARQRVITHCEQHGCCAEFDPAPLGGLTLTLQRKDGHGNGD